MAADSATSIQGLPSGAAPWGETLTERAPLASFLVRTGELKGRRLHVRLASATIGRSDSSDVVIADSSVGSEHAILRRRGGLWMLIDVGSTTGTYVDGEPVVDETPLIAGASVRFGQVTTLFEPHDDQVGDDWADDVLMRPEGEAGRGWGEPPSQTPAFAAEREPAARGETRSETHPEIPPEPSSGLTTGWLIAAVIAAAAAGAAIGFVLIR